MEDTLKVTFGTLREMFNASLASKEVLEEANRALNQGKVEEGAESALKVLLDAGVPIENVAAAFAAHKKWKYANLRNNDGNQKAIKTLSGEDAVEHSALPYDVEPGGRGLKIATTNPENTRLRKALEHKLPTYDIELVYETAEVLENALKKAHALQASTNITSSKTAAAVATSETDNQLDIGMVETGDNAATSKALSEVVHSAVRSKASDIFFMPGENTVDVKLKINGELRPAIKELSHGLYTKVASRLILSSNLDLAEHNRPQDGRAKATVEGKFYNFRVAITPSVKGPYIVLRLLGDAAKLGIDEIGLSQKNKAALEWALDNKQGMVLVTGATGSGKSTTLYAFLRKFADMGTKNIITMEDPVENRVDGLNQIQVNEKHGRGFSDILRAAMRSAPDIIFVGEIRDEETANQAARAAETGHLVLSTLHTNSAAATAARIVNMGVEPYRVASSVRCIIAQTLVQRLCPNCRQPLPKAELAKAVDLLKASSLGLPKNYKLFVRGNGCAKCDRTGTVGRIACHEVMTMNEEVKVAIVNNERESVIESVARKAGMRTLRQDAWDKAVVGIVDAHEAMSVGEQHLDLRKK